MKENERILFGGRVFDSLTMRGLYRRVCWPAVVMAVVLAMVSANDATHSVATTSSPQDGSTTKKNETTKHCPTVRTRTMYRRRNGRLESTEVVSKMMMKCTPAQPVCCDENGCCSHAQKRAGLMISYTIVGVIIFLVVVVCTGILAFAIWKKKKNAESHRAAGPSAFTPYQGGGMGNVPLGGSGGGAGTLLGRMTMGGMARGPPMGAVPMGGMPMGAVPMGGPPMGAGYPPPPPGAGYYSPPPPPPPYPGTGPADADESSPPLPPSAGNNPPPPGFHPENTSQNVTPVATTSSAAKV